MTFIIKTAFIASVSVITLLSAGCAEASTADQLAQAADVETVDQAAALIDVKTDMMWEINQEGSHLKFTAQQEGKDFTGEFETFSGTIAFDPDAPETSAVEIEIPLGSIDAGSTDRNSTVPGKVWFSTKKFPTAVFASDDISRDGDAYLAKGSLTLKGQSVPFELPFTLNVDKDQAVMTSEVTMDRTDWNVGSKPWDTDEWVSRSVTLNIQVTADKIAK